MSPQQPVQQEERVKLNRYAQSPKFETGKEIKLISKASIRRQVYDQYAELLTDLWAEIRNGSPKYKIRTVLPVIKNRS